MSTILLVTSSIGGDASVSNKVAHALADHLRTQAPDTTIVVRDLAAMVPTHISAAIYPGWMKPIDERTPQEAEALALTEQLTSEVLQAETIIVASAMINFSITSTLKAWIDHVTRFGVTFGYDMDRGESVGLVTGRKFYVVIARGGNYSDGAAAEKDFQLPYIKAVLKFIGGADADIETIIVEGLAAGPDVAQSAIDRALAQIAAIPA